MHKPWPCHCSGLECAMGYNNHFTFVPSLEIQPMDIWEIFHSTQWGQCGFDKFLQKNNGQDCHYSWRECCWGEWSGKLYVPLCWYLSSLKYFFNQFEFPSFPQCDIYSRSLPIKTFLHAAPIVCRIYSVLTCPQHGHQLVFANCDIDVKRCCAIFEALKTY